MSNERINEVLRAERASREAVDPPRRIFLIGVWLIFGPSFPVVLYSVFLVGSAVLEPGHVFRYRDGSTMTVEGGNSLASWVVLLATMGVATLHATMLWRTTARFVRARRALRRPKAPRWSETARGFPVLLARTDREKRD